MDSIDLLNLLLDEKKEIGNWNAILTYLSERMAKNDLDGLYNIAKAFAYRAELAKGVFSTSEIINIYLFLCDILCKEFVPWRCKQHLNYIDDELMPKLMDNLSEEHDEIEEIARLEYEIAIRYKNLNLAKKSSIHFNNAKNYYLEIKNIEDASYCYKESLYMINRLPKEEQTLPNDETLKKDFPLTYQSLIDAKNNKNALLFDPIEQSEKYQSCINLIEEKLVRLFGVITNPLTNQEYIKSKKFLLKEEEIEWKTLKELNKNLKI